MKQRIVITSQTTLRESASSKAMEVRMEACLLLAAIKLSDKKFSNARTKILPIRTLQTSEK